jgi:hypothetical protein
MLYRLTTSLSQANSESEQDLRDCVTFLSHDCAKRDFVLAFFIIDILMKSIIFRLKMPPPSRRSKTNFKIYTWLAVMVNRLTIRSAIRKIKSQKREPNPLVLALSNLVPPPTPRMWSPPQRQRLALGTLNTILLKPTDMVGMSAPSLRSFTSRFLRIREKEKSSILTGISWIPILRSRASFTRIPK